MTTRPIAVILGAVLLAAAHAAGAPTVYRNGNIYTMDPARPRAQAIAVDAGRILAVGAEVAVNDDESRVVAVRHDGAEQVLGRGVVGRPGAGTAGAVADVRRAEIDIAGDVAAAGADARLRARADGHEDGLDMLSFQQRIRDPCADDFRLRDAHAKG